MKEKHIGLSIFILGLAILLALLYQPGKESAPVSSSPLPQSSNKPETPSAENKLSTPSTETNLTSKSLTPIPTTPSIPVATHHEIPPQKNEAVTPNQNITAIPPAPLPNIAAPPTGIPAKPIIELPPHPSETGPHIQTVSSGPATSKQIAITFDDGPHPTITLKILDVLRKRNVKATFFVLGSRVKQYPSILRQIVAEGHEIGNHSYSHRFLSAMTNESIKREIIDTQDAIKNAVGYEVSLFRPPYGAFRPDTKEIFQENHLNIILWSVDPKDWSVRNREKISQYIINHTHNGSIVLCHDIHQSTLEALPDILDELISKGYEFTTVSQLCSLPPMKPIESHPSSQQAAIPTLTN